MRTSSLAEVPSSPLNRHVIVSMQSPMRIARTPKLISPDELNALVQIEGRPISGAEYTLPTSVAHEFVKPLRV